MPAGSSAEAALTPCQIWTAADLVTMQRGADAPTVARAHAEELLAQGDKLGWATFLEIAQAAETLLGMAMAEAPKDRRALH